MKAIISSKNEKLFNPEFHTAIGGQSVRLSKEELKKNWNKYIYSPVAFLYENLSDLRSVLKKSKGADSDPLVLDMSKAKRRGIVFDQKNKIAEFKNQQATRREKMKKRHEAQLDRERKVIAKAKKSANDKARREAKKAVK